MMASTEKIKTATDNYTTVLTNGQEPVILGRLLYARCGATLFCCRENRAIPGRYIWIVIGWTNNISMALQSNEKHHFAIAKTEKSIL